MIAFSVGCKHGYFQLLCTLTICRRLREVLARDVSTLTALETVSGPGYCLITSMPRVWSLERRVLRGGGLLGRHESCVVAFCATAVHTLFARTAGVNVSRVPQVPVWTCGGYLGIRCAEGIAFTHTPR